MSEINLTKPDESLINNTYNKIKHSNIEKIKNINFRSCMDGFKKVINEVKAPIEQIDLIVPTTPQSESKNSSSFSDKASIKLNNIQLLTVEVKNYFYKNIKDKARAEKLYNMFCEYVKGKKLFGQDQNAILSSEGKFNIPSDLDNKDYEEFFYLLSECSYVILEKTDEISELEIVELINTENNYDAVVLKDKNGNYIISGSKTNPEDVGDIAAISYVLQNKLQIGSDILEYISKLSSITDKEVAKKIMEALKDEAKLKNYYQKQIEDSSALIERYAQKAKEEGKTLEIGGFSLGGGIILAAYSKLKFENPKITDTIKSITTYNAFLEYLEPLQKLNIKAKRTSITLDKKKFGTVFLNKTPSIWPGLAKFLNKTPSIWPGLAKFLKKLTSYERLTTEKVLNSLKNDTKLTMYTNEGDVVSTFNNYKEILDDRIIYVKPKEKIETKVKTKGAVNGIIDFYKYIITGKGNHGVNSIDDASFDRLGNIIKEGDYIPINELVAILFNKQPSSNAISEDKIDLSYILDLLLKAQLSDKNLTEAGFEGLDLSTVIEYICKNIPSEERITKISLIVVSNMTVDKICAWLKTKNGKDKIESLVKKMFNSDGTNIDNKRIIEFFCENEKFINGIINTLKEIIESNTEESLDIMQKLLTKDEELGYPELAKLLKDNKDKLLKNVKLDQCMYDFFETDQGRKIINDSLEKNGYWWLPACLVNDTIASSFNDLVSDEGNDLIDILLGVKEGDAKVVIGKYLKGKINLKTILVELIPFRGYSRDFIPSSQSPVPASPAPAPRPAYPTGTPGPASPTPTPGPSISVAPPSMEPAKPRK